MNTFFQNEASDSKAIVFFDSDELNKPKKKINSFDCDGVITLGIYPGPDDVIITGRSFEETDETLHYLRDKGIFNHVFFNQLKYDEKTRKSSGIHKGNKIVELFQSGIIVEYHFEDDADQYKEINKIIKKHKIPTKVIRINHHGIINLENQRRNII